MSSLLNTNENRKKLETKVPCLVGREYVITSDDNPIYNCIAWALGESNRWWDPFEKRRYWPKDLKPDPRTEAFVKLFCKFDFITVGLSETHLEKGFEKIAIYEEGGEFQHVARQLPDGRWASKLGPYEDIEHVDLDSICGPNLITNRDAKRVVWGGYGSLAVVMKRKRPVQD